MRTKRRTRQRGGVLPKMKKAKANIAKIQKTIKKDINIKPMRAVDKIVTDVFQAADRVADATYMPLCKSSINVSKRLSKGVHSMASRLTRQVIRKIPQPIQRASSGIATKTYQGYGLYLATLDKVIPFLVNQKPLPHVVKAPPGNDYIDQWAHQKRLQLTLVEKRKQVFKWQQHIHKMYNPSPGAPQMSPDERCRMASKLEKHIKEVTDEITDLMDQLAKGDGVIVYGALKKSKRRSSKKSKRHK